MPMNLRRVARNKETFQQIVHKETGGLAPIRASSLRAARPPERPQESRSTAARLAAAASARSSRRWLPRHTAAAQFLFRRMRLCFK